MCNELGQWVVVVKCSKLRNLFPGPGSNCGRHRQLSSSDAWYMTCNYLPGQGGYAAWSASPPPKFPCLHRPCLCRLCSLCFGAYVCALSGAGGRKPKRHPYLQCSSWFRCCRRRCRRRFRCRCRCRSRRGSRWGGSPRTTAPARHYNCSPQRDQRFSPRECSASRPFCQSRAHRLV